MSNKMNLNISRIDRLAGKKGSRHSAQNQADGEKLATGLNSSNTGPTVYQNRDVPKPEPTDPPSKTNTIKSKRYKWTREEHKQVLTAYYTAIRNPKYNTTQQTYDTWRKLTGFDHHPNMDPNKLGCVRRYIEKKFSSTEIEEIKLCTSEDHNQTTGAIGPAPENEEIEEVNHVPTTINESQKQKYQPSEKCSEVKNHILRELSISKYLDMESRDQLPKIQLNKKNIEKIDMYNNALAEVLQEIEIEMDTLNSLIYATAKAATKSMGIDTIKKRNLKTRPEPKWKARIRREIESMRGELSIITEVEKGNDVKTRRGRKIRKKYNFNDKNSLLTAKEILKQKISLKSQRLRRYEKRVKFYRQNRIFKTDAKKLYREIGNQTIEVKNPPNMKDVENFWKTVWCGDKEFNENALWLEKESSRTDHIDQQEWEEFCVEEIKGTLKKSHKWKSPGKDKIPNFWLNSLTAAHQPLTNTLNEIMKQPDKIPPWLSDGMTYLIPKTKETEDPKNYRPITCLTTTYKLLSAMITDRIHLFLDQNDIFPNEQKGCKKKCYGCKDQLMINKTIIETCKRKHHNLSTAWIDYRKAFDSIPHKWILKSLELYKISPAIIGFLKQAMTQWTTKLILTHSDGICVSDNLSIDRGIFQGDSLSPLLFCLALIPISNELNSTGYGYRIQNRTVSHLLYMDDLKLYGKNDDQLQGLVQTVKNMSDDIGMEFGLDKCAKATFRRGKVTSTSNINLNTKDMIKELDQEGVYKYLGIEEGDGIQHNKMKEKIRREYYRRIRLILKTELNSKNKIQALNTLAVPVVTYSFNVIDWNLSDIQRMDTKTRKLLTSNRMHHPKADVDRIYLARKKGGRGLIQLALAYKTTTIGFYTYLNTTSDWMLEIVRKHDSCKNLHSVKKEADRYRMDLGITEQSPATNVEPTDAAKRTKLEAKRAGIKDLEECWREKPLHGRYPTRINEADIDPTSTHQWLSSSGLKAETEGFIMAAQDQSLNTRNYQAHIIKNGTNPKCRLCDDKPETIDHIVAGCSVLAPTEYKTRHDRIGQYLHWTICKNFGAPHAEKWYEHHPDPVTESHQVTILWDFPIQTDRTIKANRPDIVIKDLGAKKCTLIDMTVPADHNIAPKEYEKLSKYKDLEIEIGKMWHLDTSTVPVVVGALGALKRGSKEFIDQIPGKPDLSEVQKIALTSTAHILRKFLSI